MSHKRVIPRDFFNESKLLKCLGAFVIAMERFKALSVEENDEPFEIQQSESGELYCSNYNFNLLNERIFLFTSYNSKDAYPMYARIATVDIQVFNEDGTFHDDFKSLFVKRNFVGTWNGEPA